jgi:hypothetical protein
MSETKKLQGKLAVITGGTTGIGLSTAKLFVKEGAYVFITGRRQKELDEAVQAIGSNVTGVQGHIAKFTDLDRFPADRFDVQGTVGTNRIVEFLYDHRHDITLGSDVGRRCDHDPKHLDLLGHPAGDTSMSRISSVMPSFRIIRGQESDCAEPISLILQYSSKSCLRLVPKVVRLLDQKLAVHSRYTVFRSFRFLQGLGERPGPCKYYVSLYAIFLSRR